MMTTCNIVLEKHDSNNTVQMYGYPYGVFNACVYFMIIRPSIFHHIF